MDIYDPDAAKFYEWKRKMKVKDEQQLMQHREKKRIQMQLSKQAAIKAVNDKLKTNKLLVTQIKKQNKSMLQQKQRQVKSELEEKRKIVKNVIMNKTSGKEMEKIVQNNKRLHDEQKQKMKVIIQKKKQQTQIQMQHKKQLIKQIRSYLQQPRNTIKIIDPTQTMGFGLLEEMCLADLRQKLKQVQVQYKIKEETKRKQILQNKSITQIQKKLKLQKFQEQVAHRTQVRDEQRKTRKRQIAQQKQKIQQLRIKSMNEFNERQKIKYALRRQQKQELQKTLKQINQKRQFLNQNQAAVQAQAFKNLQLGAQRQILQRQNLKLMNKYKIDQANCKDRSLIGEQKRRKIKQKIQFHKTYEKQRQQANRVYQQLQNQDKLYKAAKFHEVKTFEQKHTQSLNQRSDYNTKINQMSLNRNKAH